MASPAENSPIGTTVMDTRVLKEPRGFMRCLEWLFAIIAFATCCDFSTTSEYSITCSNSNVTNVSHLISYPFKLDHDEHVNVTCGGTKAYLMYPPGDYSSDAQFFVFTGVVSFLGTMASLVVYVFFSEMYLSEQKRAPMFDFCFTIIVAVFWLSASSAWANGVINMKWIANPQNWIYGSGVISQSICEKNPNGQFVSTLVKNCEATFMGNFAKANVSIIVGFLNFFLWASNLWFLYKETTWFAGTAGSQPEQMAS